MRLLHKFLVIGLSLGLYACSTQPESNSTAATLAVKPQTLSKATPAVVKPNVGVATSNVATDALTGDVQAMQGTWSLMSFPIFTIQGTDLVLVENKAVSKLQVVGHTLQGKMQDPRGNICDAVLKLKQADALEINRTNCLDKNRQPLSYHIGGAKLFYRTGTAKPLSNTSCEEIIKKRKNLKNAMQKAALGSDERLNLASEYLKVEQIYKDKLCAVMDARP
jgi:hypothetical protein